MSPDFGQASVPVHQSESGHSWLGSTRRILPWSMAAALPPAIIEYFYVTAGPAGDSSRTQFVVAFLALLMATLLLGALAPHPAARVFLLGVAFGGILALGAVAGFSFGLFLWLAAVPAGVAISKAFGDLPSAQAWTAISVGASVAVALLAAGLYFTHL